MPNYVSKEIRDDCGGQKRHLGLPKSASFLDRFGARTAGFLWWMEFAGLRRSPENTASAGWLRRDSGPKLTSGLRHTEKPETELTLRWSRWVAGNRRIGIGVRRRQSSLKYPLQWSSSSSSIAGDIPLPTGRLDLRTLHGGASSSSSSSAPEESCVVFFFFRRPRISAENQDPDAESLGALNPGSAASDLVCPNRVLKMENLCLRPPSISSSLSPREAAVNVGPIWGVLKNRW